MEREVVVEGLSLAERAKDDMGVGKSGAVIYNQVAVRGLVGGEIRGGGGGGGGFGGYYWCLLFGGLGGGWDGCWGDGLVGEIWKGGKEL